MGIELALNLVLAGLLAAVIVYAILLNKRLGAWRDGKAELAKAAAQFTAAAERAELAIVELKAASEASGRLLEDQTRRALFLKDDLEMLVERAEPVADRLVDRVRAGASPVQMPQMQMPPVQTPQTQTPTPLSNAAARVPLRPAALAETADVRSPVRSMAEQELLRAIAERRKAGASAGAQFGARGA
jgi:hypothetical protein